MKTEHIPSEVLRIVSERDNLHGVLKKISEDKELQTFLQEYAEKTADLDSFRNFPGLPDQLILYDWKCRFYEKIIPKATNFFAERKDGESIRDVLYLSICERERPRDFRFAQQMLGYDDWWTYRWDIYKVEKRGPGGFYLNLIPHSIYSRLRIPNSGIYNGRPITEVEPLKNVKPREILSTLERSLSRI